MSQAGKPRPSPGHESRLRCPQRKPSQRTIGRGPSRLSIGRPRRTARPLFLGSESAASAQAACRLSAGRRCSARPCCSRPLGNTTGAADGGGLRSNRTMTDVKERGKRSYVERAQPGPPQLEGQAGRAESGIRQFAGGSGATTRMESSPIPSRSKTARAVRVPSSHNPPEDLDELWIGGRPETWRCLIGNNLGEYAPQLMRLRES